MLFLDFILPSFVISDFYFCFIFGFLFGIFHIIFNKNQFLTRTKK